MLVENVMNLSELFLKNSKKKLPFYVCIYAEMVIDVGNGHGDPSSNPGQSCLRFT